MIELIKLEWKKNKTMKYGRNAVITTVILLIFIVSMAGEFTADTSMEVNGQNELHASVDIFVNICYMVFTGVMLAAFVIGSYEKRTIHLMFSYPISRKKILLSKILAVWIFNFVAMVVSKVMAYAILLMKKVPADMIPFPSVSFWLNILIGSAAMISITYIALLIGMKMKSSKATIIASIVIVCLTQGNIGSYTLKDNVVFFTVLLALSAVSVFMSIYNVETKDVM